MMKKRSLGQCNTVSEPPEPPWLQPLRFLYRESGISVVPPVRWVEANWVTGKSAEYRFPIVKRYPMTLENLPLHFAFLLLHASMEGRIKEPPPFYQTAIAREDWRSPNASQWEIFTDEMTNWIRKQDRPENRMPRPIGMEATAFAWFYQMKIAHDHVAMSPRVESIIAAHARLNELLAWWCPLEDRVLALRLETTSEGNAVIGRERHDAQSHEKIGAEF